MQDIITNEQPTRLTMIGGGSWATAIIKMLSENNVQVNWWMRSEEAVQHIKKYHHNPSYLSSVAIDLEKIMPMSDIIDAMTDTDYVIIAVPSAFVIDALKKLRKRHFKDKKIVSAVKGMVGSRNETVTAYIQRRYGVSQKRLMVIAGPCHAEEVAYERQSYLTIAGHKYSHAEQFAGLLSCRYIKIIASTDPLGVQYAAAIKNIVALAGGIASGLNYGDNFQAVLVSNALQETRRFIDKVCPHDERDIDASAYLGDLLVTAYSQFSRNRTFGMMVGKGYSVKSAQMEMNMIAEGYYAVKAMYQINQEYKVSLPIIRAVYNILYERISPVVELQILKGKLR